MCIRDRIEAGAEGEAGEEGEAGAGNGEGGEGAPLPRLLCELSERLFDLAADPRETTDLSAEQPSKVDELLDALRDFAAVTVEPMQWVPPFQGDDYECAACPLRNATGPYEPWAPWM